MDVKETRCDHHSHSINYLRSVKRFGRDCCDLSAANADVAHSIQPTFGINNPPALQNEIIGSWRPEMRAR